MYFIFSSIPRIFIISKLSLGKSFFYKSVLDVFVTKSKIEKKEYNIFY